MNLRLHFFLLNDNFSPEYAEANHGGEESENNPKYEWEDELEITGLESIGFVRNAVFPLQGELPSGEAFSENLTNMFCVKLLTDKQQEAFLGVSESILEDFDYQEEGDSARLKVYIRDYEPHANPIPGVYVASKEFPKELIF